MAKGADVYQSVTDAIVAKLESGAGPWAPSWKGGCASRPLRSCGIPYSGVNTLMLWLSAAAHGYQSPYWLTFKQAQELGGCVRKGEKSTRVVFFTVLEKEEKGADGESVKRGIPLLREYCVFNAEQCDNLPARFYPADADSEGGASEADRLDAVDTFARNTGASIGHGGGRAFYSPSSDSITMPEFGRFNSAEAYASVLMHELTHWTGKAGRCGRDLSGRFGDSSYAMEELIAELGAAFALADLGVRAEPRDDHASYVAGWLKVLKSDKRAIFTAAKAAADAVEFMRSLQTGAAVVESSEVGV